MPHLLPLASACVCWSLIRHMWLPRSQSREHPRIRQESLVGGVLRTTTPGLLAQMQSEPQWTHFVSDGDKPPSVRKLQLVWPAKSGRWDGGV